MKKLNSTLDREPMTSQAIRERQDFNYILKETVAAKIPIWKSIWFYGPVGIAMVTMVVSAIRMNPKNEKHDNKITLSQFNTTNSEDNTVNTITVERSEKVLPETKSNSNNDNVTPTEPVAQKVNPSINTTPVIKADPAKVDSAFLVKEQLSAAPEEKLIYTPVPVVEKKAVRTMPNIAGVFNGRISASQICSAGMIDCNNGYEVVSYHIQYDNGIQGTVDRVSGNRIPSNICASLKRFNVGSPVFITKIIAMNDKGERIQLLSMNIEPTF